MIWAILQEKFRWRKHYRRWKEKNSHNFCEIQSYFNIDNVTIGKNSYGMINAHIYNNPEEKLSIGSFCSIAEGVHFVFSEHDYHRMCMFPFTRYVMKREENNTTKGPIKVEDDVWIGQGSMILSGVTIHQGAVIGAGSVVAQDIPPYAVYARGEIIKYRFEPEIIEALLQIDYSRLTDKMVSENLGILYSSDPAEWLGSDLYRQLTSDRK